MVFSCEVDALQLTTCITAKAVVIRFQIAFLKMRYLHTMKRILMVSVLMLVTGCEVQDPQTPEFLALQKACQNGNTQACFQVEQIRAERQRQQNELLFGGDTVIVY